MPVIGYQPGKAVAHGSAANWTSAVARIVCRYETNAGQLVVYTAGSGFVLDAWPGVVLTARHVVVRPPAVDATRMSVVVGVSNGSAFEEVDALGVAYPVDVDTDVAAILIPGASATGLALADPFPTDGEHLNGVAIGYVGAGMAPTLLASRVARVGSLLRELDKPSIAGMSGGPVCADGGDVGSVTSGAFGIQSRDNHGHGLATVIDFDVLNECALSARSFFP